MKILRSFANVDTIHYGLKASDPRLTKTWSIFRTINDDEHSIERAAQTALGAMSVFKKLYDRMEARVAFYGENDEPLRRVSITHHAGDPIMKVNQSGVEFTVTYEVGVFMIKDCFAHVMAIEI